MRIRLFLIIMLLSLLAGLDVSASTDNTIELQFADNYDMDDGCYLVSSYQGNQFLGSDLSEEGVTRYYWQRAINDGDFYTYNVSSSPDVYVAFAALGYTYSYRRMVILSDGTKLYSNVIKLKCTASVSTANVCQYQPFVLVFNGPNYDHYQWYMNDSPMDGENSIKLRVSDGLESSADFYLDCYYDDESTHYKSYYRINTKDVDVLDEIKDQYTLLPGEDSHSWTDDEGNELVLCPGESFSYYDIYTMRYPVCEYQITTMSVRHDAMAVMPSYTKYYDDSKVGEDIFGYVTDENGNSIADYGTVQYYIYDSTAADYVAIPEGDTLLPGVYRMYISFISDNEDLYPSVQSDVADEIVLYDISAVPDSTYRRYCTGDYMDLGFTLLTGKAVEYRLDFSDSCDMESVGWTALDSDSIVYQIMDYDNYGDNFSVTLTLKGESGRDTSFVYHFGLNIPNWYVHSKYHDVVFVDNHEDLFAQYQWYKDGELQPGKTGQFWQDVSGDNQGLEGWYMARVVTVNGDTYFTCPVFYDDLRISNHFFAYAYPNPVRALSDVTIELKDITDDQLVEAVVYIYTASGRLAEVIRNVDRQNVASLPIGEYVAKVVVGRQVQSLKIIVR